MNLSGMFGFLNRLMPWRGKTRAGVKPRPVKATAVKAAGAKGAAAKPAADPRAAAKRARAAARINRKGKH